MIWQVGIAGESPGNIAGAELVALPLFPKVEQLVFVGRDFIVPLGIIDIFLGIEFATF